MDDIDLGFPEKCETGFLANRYFPSKVGGKPAWLELDAIPSIEEIRCAKCANPKSFLCQIYAPFDDAHNFHRTIYVFACRTGACQERNKSSNFTVFRSQLPRLNAFYPQAPPSEDGNALPEVPPKKRTCAACGCHAPSTCSKCKQTHYCSSQHQRAHWRHHKKVCSPTITAEEITCSNAVLDSQIVFPEWEIVIENDETVSSTAAGEERVDDDASEEKRLSEYERLVAEGKTGELKDVPDSELDKYVDSADAVNDKHFGHFKKVVAKEPEQIIRYKRNGQPLWIADVDTTIAAQLNVPNCESCNGPRQFEFQIMPQMILLLKDEHIDWGVLTVFTCAASCKLPAGIGYVNEYIIKQDILPS